MPVFKQYTESSYKWGIWKTSESLEELACFTSSLKKNMKRVLENLQPFLVSWSGWLCVYYYIQCLAKRKKYTIIPMAGPILADGSFSISISHTKGYVVGPVR